MRVDMPLKKETKPNHTHAHRGNGIMEIILENEHGDSNSNLILH